MARPVYIICSSGISVDRESNLLTAFSIIENITALAVQPAREGVVVEQGPPFYVCACWMAEPDSGDTSTDVYEHETRMRPPGRTEYVKLETGAPPFKFDIEGGLRLQRVVLALTGGLPIDRSGTLLVEHRIRKVGSDNWLSQDYPITVQVVDQAGSQPRPEQAA